MWKNPEQDQPPRPAQFIKQWMEAENGTEDKQKLERKVLEFLVDQWEKTYTTEIDGQPITLKADWEDGKWVVKFM